MIYKIPLIRNAFYNEKQTRKELTEFILSDQPLSMGEKCKEFELEFSKWQGRKYSVLFNSGASANLALLQSMKNMEYLKVGDNVGFSALTWSTNVMPIIQMGFNPMPIDVKINTLNVCNDNLKQFVKGTFKCLFITNALGLSPDYEFIKKYCYDNQIILIEDNCESLGTETKEGKLGNMGLAATFSFYVAHHLSTIEGGMVCTDDKNLYNMLKMVRANGWDRNLDKEIQEKLRSNHVFDTLYYKYLFYDLAYNLRPTEITGFLGCNQLKYINEIILKRETNFIKIFIETENNTDIIPILFEHEYRTSSFAIPFIFKTKELKEKYLKRFKRAGIETRPIIAGNIQEQPFYKKYIKEVYPLPNTQFIHDNAFYCGNYPEMNQKEIETIIGCIK